MTILKELQGIINFKETDIKELGDMFEEFLKKSGVKNIKDIPNDNPYNEDDYHKEVWLIK